MTLADAVAAFERDFTVSAAVGHPDPDSDRVDMSRAPTGDAYVTITSGGEITDRDVMPAWFASDDAAARAWLREAWSFAESQGGSTVYWRERPVIRRAEFVALNQPELMQDPMMRRSVTINVATVVSRLFVSHADLKTETPSKETVSAAQIIEDRPSDLRDGSVGRRKPKRHHAGV